MIVLHAIWDTAVSGQLHIWAESSSASITATRRSRKSAEDQKPRLHPFVLPHASLREAVGELAGSLLAKSAGIDTLAVRLPSSAKGPLSSPELILGQEDIDLQDVGFKR